MGRRGCWAVMCMSFRDFEFRHPEPDMRAYLCTTVILRHICSLCNALAPLSFELCGLGFWTPPFHCMLRIGFRQELGSVGYSGLTMPSGYRAFCLEIFNSLMQT